MNDRNKKLNDIFLDLRKLLQESSVPAKKDKINILKNTSEHILQLQQAIASAQNWLAHQLPNPKLPRFNPLDDSSDAIYENMFRKTNVALLIVDLDGQIKECNLISCQLFQVPEHALRTLSFFQFLPPSDLPDIYRAFALLLSSPQVSVHSMKKFLYLADTQLSCVLSMWQVTTSAGESSLIQIMILPAPPTPSPAPVTSAPPQL